ncbi:MAG: hypothetical protein ACPKQO_06315 [Nitrososphaeraceae archaeon]
MKIDHVLAIGFVVLLIVLVMVIAMTIFSNGVYGYSKTSMFVQDNNFTITKSKDGVSIIAGWGLSGSGLIGKPYSIVLEFENGTKTSYSNIKTISGDNRGLHFEIGNNAKWWSQEQISDEDQSVGSTFVQNNKVNVMNSTISIIDIQSGELMSKTVRIGNNFLQNNNIILESEGSRGFTSNENMMGN